MEPTILVVPGASDALTALVIQEAEFEAVYVTGAGFSNATLGQPDIDLATMTEVAEHIGRIADVVRLPIIADADTGHGGVLNVRRTIRAFEHAGAAAIQLEDQATPKRCGHFDGHQLITAGEMVQKIHAAVDSRRNDETLVIARTDAAQTEGFASAVDRANKYVEAGADCIFVEAPGSHEDLEKVPKIVAAPLIANMVEGGKTPLMAADDLQALGYSIVLYANAALRASVKATREVLQALKRDGGTVNVLDRIIDFDDRQQLVGLPQMQELEARYLGPTEE